MIELTIIIPVFNCEEYLANGLEGLKPLFSSNINFEIIYVNDGSTDNSAVVLGKIQEEYEFIKVIHQENQGSSGARNTGIEIAKGEYIQFLDSDDLLDIGKVIVMLKDAQRNNYDLYGYRMDFVDENYTQIAERNKYPLEYNKTMSGIQSLIEGYQPSSICVFLFKTKLFIDNDLRIYPGITHMDVEFMTRIMICANKVIFKDIIAYHYLQRPGSITKPKTKEKLEKFIFDEVTISKLMKANIINYNIIDLNSIDAIMKNYNSVVWNLLWRLTTNRKEVDFNFKVNCIKSLKDNKLYPIKGPLKSRFQRLTKPFFNLEWLLKIMIK